MLVVVAADGAEDIPGQSVWSFDAADPIRISVVLSTEASPEVPWTFARALLQEALAEGMAGLADVRMHVQGTTLRMTFTSPEGQAHVELDATVVSGFLSRTAVAYPMAEQWEEDAYPWNDIILELLREPS